MFSRIAHVAIYTESYEKMVNFYKGIFGMKQITSGCLTNLDNAGPT
jgi:catechol 2,3-dioxygenase-like lactoylglutathione lyase family enzyme